MLQKIKLTPKLLPDQDELLTSESAQDLLDARVKLGVQQKAVALEVGISAAYLHDLEQKRRRLRLRMFQRIKAALEKLG